MAGPSLIATLGANITPFTKSLNEARGQAAVAGKGISGAFGGGMIGNAGAKIASSISGHLGGVVAGAFALHGIESAIDSAIKLGSTINDTSLRLGMSTDEVQEWDYALKQNGSSMEAAKGYFEKLGVARLKALSGSKEQVDDFNKLGISIDDLKSKGISDLSAKIGMTIKDGDIGDLIGALRGVGGKGAGEMVATYQTAFSELKDEAHKFGVILGASAVSGLDDAGDRIDRLKAKMAVDMAEPIATAFSWLSESLSKIGDMIDIYIIRPLHVLSYKFSMKEMFSDPLGHAGRIFDDVSESIKNNEKQHEKAATDFEAAEKSRRDRKKALSDKVNKFDQTDEKRDDELKKLKDQTDEEERRGKNAAMTETEKVTAIKKQIDLLKSKMDSEKDLVEKAKDGLELQKLKNELSRAESSRVKEIEGLDKEVTSADEQRRKMLRKTEPNAMDKIGVHFGGYGIAPEIAAIDSAQRRESILLRISESTAATRRAVEMIADMDKSPSQSDVKF